MTSKEEFEVLDIFKKNMFRDLSISELMKLSKKETKTWLFNVLKGFKKGGFLIEERKGNLNLYKANLENPLLIQHFLFLESLKLIGFEHIKLISKIISKIPIKNYCFLIFGSYADKKYDKKSDMDLCFLIGNKEDEKKIRPVIKDIKLKSLVKIDDNYITFGEFIKMLLREEENLGKEIYRKHILLFNGNIFYELIKEAHKNGFKG